jgi:hypothetical protein
MKKFLLITVLVSMGLVFIGAIQKYPFSYSGAQIDAFHEWLNTVTGSVSTTEALLLDGHTALQEEPSEGGFENGDKTLLNSALQPEDILDEDDFASDSASLPPSQQSVGAYINTKFTAPGTIGAVTPAPTIYTDRLEPTASATQGDAVDFREGTNYPGSNFTRIKGQDSQDYSPTLLLPNFQYQTYVGEFTMMPRQSSNFNIYGQDLHQTTWPVTSTGVIANLGSLASAINADFKIANWSDGTISVTPDSNDHFCYDNSGTFTHTSDGNSFSLTAPGIYSFQAAREGDCWYLAQFTATGTDTGSGGCEGVWNCGIEDDTTHTLAYFKFESGAFATDAMGNYSAGTLYNTPTADTVWFIEGAASMNLASASSQYFAIDTTDTDVFGWNSSGKITIFGAFNADSSTVSSAMFNKSNCVQIQYTSASQVSLRIYNGSGWDAHYYGTACTDGNGYFIMVTIDTSTSPDSYAMYVWDDTLGSKLGSYVSGDLSTDVINLSSASLVSIGNSGGYNADGSYDAWFFRDDNLNQTDFEQLVVGAYGN